MLRRLGRWLTAASLFTGGAPQRPEITSLVARGSNPVCVDARVAVPLPDRPPWQFETVGRDDDAAGRGADEVAALQFEGDGGSLIVPVLVARGADAAVSGCFHARGGAFTVTLEARGRTSEAWRVDASAAAVRVPAGALPTSAFAFDAAQAARGRVHPGFLDASPFELPSALRAAPFSVRMAPPSGLLAPPYGAAVVAFPSDQGEWPGGGDFSSPVEREVTRTLGDAPFRVVEGARRNAITFTIAAQNATPPSPVVPRFMISPAAGWRAASAALLGCRTDLAGNPPTVVSYAWDAAEFRAFDADSCLEGKYTRCMDVDVAAGDVIVSSAVSVTVWAPTNTWWGDPRCWMPPAMPSLTTFLRDTFAHQAIAQFEPRFTNGTLERWRFVPSSGPFYGWAPAVMRVFHFGFEGDDPRDAFRRYMIGRGALNVTFLDEVVLTPPPSPPPPAPRGQPPASPDDTSVHDDDLDRPPPSPPAPPLPSPLPSPPPTTSPTLPPTSPPSRMPAPLPPPPPSAPRPSALYAVRRLTLPAVSTTRAPARALHLAIAALALASSALACSVFCCCFACVLSGRERRDAEIESEACLSSPLAEWDTKQS